ncbi:MAG: hypothetical protein AAF968_14035, partial [Pseudomonadota bacterium]
DGPGFDADVLPRLGDPYVSTRPRGGRGRAGRGAPGSDAYEGMGLGVFIARTLLERTGASIRFANAPAQSAGVGGEVVPKGAMVELRWPTGTVDRTKRESRQPAQPRLSA